MSPMNLFVKHLYILYSQNNKFSQMKSLQMPLYILREMSLPLVVFFLDKGSEIDDWKE